MKCRPSILIGILVIIGIIPLAATAESASVRPELVEGQSGGSTSSPRTEVKDPYAKTPEVPAGNLSCPADLMVTNERCEGGLCLKVAPGGVTSDSVLLKGTAKVDGVTGLLVQSQHDRTKTVVSVNATKALNADGTFEITVPLAQLGSYSIVIQATRVGGSPQVITAHVSRVIAPHDLTSAAVTIPDPKSGEDHVMIAVDLEKSCREQVKMGLLRDCDLIGSRTGGTQIDVTNTIASVRQITRHTNAGSDGQFNLCMPIGDGENKIEVQVCNPALSACSILTTKTISFSKTSPQLRWIDSDPSHLRFAIDNWKPKKIEKAQCDGEITIQWNHEVKMNAEMQKEDLHQILCPTNGEYQITSTPVVGVNELSISLPGEVEGEFHFTFGWGHAVWAKDVAASVAAMRIDHTVLDRDLPNLVNRFLTSDQFPKLLQQMLTTAPAPATDTASTPQKAEDINAIRGEIPGCTSGKQKLTRMRVMGTPVVGKVHVNEVRLEQNRLALDLTLEDVTVQLQYFKDADGNGDPDQAVLPLKIGFKTLHIRPRLALTSSVAPQALLTSDEDDCLYTAATYCKHRPSIVQPKDFKGNIDAAGAFVMCDGVGQLVPAETREACKSINNVDAKTGQISEQILEAFNETLYCDVSAQLTYALRHNKIKLNQTLPIKGRKLDWESELVLDANGLAISPDGIALSLGHRVTSTEFYYTADSTLGMTAPQGHTVGLAVREDLINQALAALVSLGNSGEGLLDLTLDEAKIATMGFDFNTECATGPDKKVPPALCQLRPTLEKLLGSDLSKANYYGKDQPLRITIHRAPGSVLAPHVRFRTSTTGEMIVDFDVPDVDLEFSALMEDATTKPIITARITALMSFTLDKIATDPKDPSQLALTVSLRRPESRVAIMPVSGSNHTIVPDYVLIGQLRDMINLGLDQFGKKGESLKTFTLPKKVLFPTTQLSESDETLMSRLGLAEIRLGEGSLQWGIDPLTHALTVTADPQLIQRLPMNGAVQEFVWGDGVKSVTQLLDTAHAPE